MWLSGPPTPQHTDSHPCTYGSDMAYITIPLLIHDVGNQTCWNHTGWNLSRKPPGYFPSSNKCLDSKHLLEPGKEPAWVAASCL